MFKSCIRIHIQLRHCCDMRQVLNTMIGLNQNVMEKELTLSITLSVGLSHQHNTVSAVMLKIFVTKINRKHFQRRLTFLFSFVLFDTNGSKEDDLLVTMLFVIWSCTLSSKAEMHSGNYQCRIP